MAFQVQLLGRFALRSATGDEISVPSKKGQALIAVLALADGAPVPRERLTGLLWSERGETQARGSLRQALTALRRVFEGVASSPLVIEADHVALDLDAAEVDAVAASALATGESADDLERAASLYRGEFLAGLQVRDPAFDDWLATERRRVQRQLLEVLGRLLAAHEADGQDKQAIATAERLLGQDPLNESTHRALMRLYAQTGERNAALRQYQSCREALERELGVSPEPVTEALYREIRAGESPSVPTPAETVETEPAAAPGSAPLPLPDKPSIAVLPFVNLSDDAEQEYFADGMTRDLITELGRFSTLGVTAATTMFGFKGRRVSVAEISRELDARYVLEGSVEKADRRIRISAQLTDAETGQQVWGDRFDGDLGDLFDIRDEIMRLISSNLYQPLLNYESLKARQKPAASADAYDFYLRALHHIDKPTRAGIEEARSACRKALEIDPDFALVYEILMWVHLHAAWNGWAEGPEPELQAARREAAHGVALDDKEPYLRGSFGFIEVFLGNDERGLKEMQTAVEQVPSDSIYRTLFGGALAIAGRAEEALTVLEEAERLSPGYHVTRLFEGQAHFLAGRLDQALGSYEQFLTVLPEFSWAWMHVAVCHVELGQLDSARDAIAQVRRHGPNMTRAYVKRLLHALDPAYVDRLLNALDTAGLPIPGEGADALTDREEPKPSVAVLPFKNLSGDSEQDYFAEGITQDIVTELARFGSLQVVARHSAFALDPALEPTDASRRLQARYVVAGNVRKAGDRVRITAQLIDGESGAHLWAERYDRKLEDIFAVQDEVVHAIVATLGGQVEAADTERALRKRPENLAAYDYYLRGLRHFDLYTRDNIEEGHRLIEKAVALEPTFARAQALFGWFNAAKWWWNPHNRTLLDRALEYASKAITLDPRDSVCWGFLANIHLYRKEFVLAEHCVEQAMTLNPSDIRASEGYGEVLCHIGRFEEALERLQHVERLEPILPTWYWEILGVTLYGLHRFADAAEAFRRMSAMNAWNHAQLAACYGQLGETDKAQEHLKAYAADAAAASLEAFAESEGFYKNPEDQELWLDGLRKAGLA